jgi:hypothetical protein
MPQAHRDKFIAPATFDNDAASLRSTSDQSSDSEDEELVEKLRTTLELDDYDSSVLREEEEREKLLTKRGPFGGIKQMFKGSSSDVGLTLGDREARRRRRKERRGSMRGLKGDSAEEGQLMFEMEEGFKDISSRSSSSDSLGLKQHNWNNPEKQVRVHSKHPTSPLTPCIAWYV